MKKCIALILVLCPIASAMDIRDAVRESRDRKRGGAHPHHRRSRSGSRERGNSAALRAMKERLDDMAASGDEAEEQIDKIERLAGSANDRLDRLERQLQILVAAHNAREQAIRAGGGDPVLLAVRRVEGTADAISDRQIENNRGVALGAATGAFVFLGLVCNQLGFGHLVPEWAWAYVPGAS